MFTVKKKKKYRNFLYGAIVVVLCMLVAVIAWPAPAAQNEENIPLNSDMTANAQKKTDGNNDLDVDYDKDPLGENFGLDDTEPEEPADDETDISDMTNAESTYYLVKKADGAVKVFFIDNQGNSVELETTQIVYELLGPDDQKLFYEGIMVKNQEELAILLQDFES